MKRVLMIAMALMLLQAASAEIYPATLIVDAVNREEDSITLRDTEGHTWKYAGVEDSQQGDLASAIMDDCDTAPVQDDIVVSLQYCALDMNAPQPAIDAREC